MFWMINPSFAWHVLLPSGPCRQVQADQPGAQAEQCSHESWEHSFRGCPSCSTARAAPQLPYRQVQACLPGLLVQECSQTYLDTQLASWRLHGTCKAGDGGSMHHHWHDWQAAV